MDFRDHSIITQVAFKGAIDLCREADVSTPEGQAYFEQVFSYLTDSLMMGITSTAPEEQAAQIIKGSFPGTTVVSQNPTPSHNPPNGQGALKVKGTQHGPLPDWLFVQAADKGVTEVWDNRDRAVNSTNNLPWFKATTGGRDATPFWPPR